MRAALPRRTSGTGGWKAGHDLTVCSRGPEGQPYPELHQKKGGPQVEEGDSDPLLCAGETTPGVLHPALEPSAQEGHGTVGVCPEEGDTDNLRVGASLLQGQTERVGAVQPGKEGGRETLWQPFSI